MCHHFWTRRWQEISTELNANQRQGSREKVGKVENACLGEHNRRNNHRHLEDDYCYKSIPIEQTSQLQKQLSPPRRWLLSCYYQIHHNCTNNTIIATWEMIITISFNLSEYSVVPIFVPNAQFSSWTEPEGCQYLHCSWGHHTLNCTGCRLSICQLVCFSAC